jgi:hypothetical protein
MSLAFGQWLAANPGRTPPMTRSRGKPAGRRGSADCESTRCATPTACDPDQVFKRSGASSIPMSASTGWLAWRLSIEGWAYVGSMHIGRRDATKIVALIPRGRHVPLLLPARQVRRPT